MEEEKIYNKHLKEGWKLYMAFGSRYVMTRKCEIKTIDVASNKVIKEAESLVPKGSEDLNQENISPYKAGSI